MIELECTGRTVQCFTLLGFSTEVDMDLYVHVCKIVSTGFWMVLLVLRLFSYLLIPSDELWLFLPLEPHPCAPPP